MNNTGKCRELSKMSDDLSDRLVTPELRQEIFELAKDLFWRVDGNQRLWSGEEREIYGLQAAMRIARSQAEALLREAQRAAEELLAAERAEILSWKQCVVERDEKYNSLYKEFKALKADNAAKDEIIDRHREAQVILGKQLNEVIADNAAQAARVTELEDMLLKRQKRYERRVVDLEAKLAAAEKALERIAARDGIPLAGSFAAEIACAYLETKPS